MLRDVIEIGHPVLRQRARELTREELATDEWQGFVNDLIETMRHRNGAGLAANQVAEPVQVCVIEVDNNPRYPYKPAIPLTVLVNPVLEPIGDDSFLNYEGCLSVPNLRGEVRRAARLSVTAWDRHGEEVRLEVAGITAGTYQHEVDHLRGVLFIDRVEDPHSLCTWAEFAERREAAFRERVAEVVATYGS